MAHQTGSIARLRSVALSRVDIKDIVRALEASEVLLPDLQAVQAYVEMHPAIVPRLTLLCADARREFPLPTELALELYRDPEIEDLDLALYVRPTEYRDGLVKQIEAFASHYDAAVDGTTGRVLVTTDFHAPGAANVIRVD